MTCPRWRISIFRVFAAGGLLVAISGALAQSFPSKPIRIVVPYAAGGDLDTLARFLSSKATEAFSQPIIVENRTGAGGNVGAGVVARAAPDGYTILHATTGLTVSPALYRNLGFDPAKDFAPITQLISSTTVLVINPKLPVTSVKEFIALAKARAGKLNYGSSGPGSTLNLSMELLKQRAGINIVHIPYKGDAPVFSALMAGEVEAAMVPLATNVANIKSGRLRALGVTTPRRSLTLPDVPTIAESGVEGFEVSTWHGFFAPAPTPRDIINVIQREFANVLKRPEVRERLLAIAQEPVGSSPEEFEAKFKGDIDKFAKLVRAANIPLLD